MLEIFAALSCRKETNTYSLKHYGKPNVDKLESNNTKLIHSHLHRHINSSFLYLLVILEIESFHVKNYVLNYIFLQQFGNIYAEQRRMWQALKMKLKFSKVILYSHYVRQITFISFSW